MNYLYTRNEHFRMFMEKHNNERLKKNLKIIPSTKFNRVFEIFDRIVDTEYKFIDNSPIKTYIFKTNSEYEYRLDLYVDEEPNIGIVNHISFTSSYIDDYQSIDYDGYKTFKYEMIEVLNRIKFILKDLLEKEEIINSFCIGGTDLEKKNNIYQDFLRTVIGKDGFDKIPTKSYHCGWGLFFKI